MVEYQGAGQTNMFKDGVFSSRNRLTPVARGTNPRIPRRTVIEDLVCVSEFCRYIPEKCARFQKGIATYR